MASMWCPCRSLCGLLRPAKARSILSISYSTTHDRKTVIKGWVKSTRKHKDVVFVDVSDGSSAATRQLVVKKEHCPNMKDLAIGASLQAEGQFVPGPKSDGSHDFEVSQLHIFGRCDQRDYPFKARTSHSLDYLRQLPHLRPRTSTFSAVLRLRNAATMAFHQYFQSAGFWLVHTPVLTSSDCEGSGELFGVQSHALDRSGEVLDFFGIPVYLTVSGQLHAEALACALSKVYTFGPTFRADLSHTRRHLAEFYMVEAEVCFAEGLGDILHVIEDMYKSVTTSLLEKCEEDIELLHRTTASVDLKEQLKQAIEKEFQRITYTEAVDILQQNKESLQIAPPEWGGDLVSQHEQFLVLHLGGTPLFVTEYPATLKPFYARPVDGNPDIVAAADLLVPGIGELAGGSMREERHHMLEQKLMDMGMADSYQWYLELRKFGTVPHGGFGLGFERFLQHVSGIGQIRDVIPFPRYLHSCQM